MKIEQPVPLRPGFDHSVASRYDRIAQKDIDLVASPENEIRPERNISGRRPLIQNRPDGVSQLRGHRGFFRADTKDQSDRTDLDLVPGIERGPTRDTVPVDRSATLAAKILNVPSLKFEQNPAMSPRYFGMGQDQIDFRGASDDDIFTAQQFRARREPGKNGDRRFQSLIVTSDVPTSRPMKKQKAVRGPRQRRAYYRCCIPALAGFVSQRSIAPDGSISIDQLRELGNGFLLRE